MGGINVSFGLLLAVAVLFYPLTVAIAVVNPEALEAAFDSTARCSCPCYGSGHRRASQLT
jgi:hypothetical protein